MVAFMAISSQGYRGLDITADGMISSPRIPRDALPYRLSAYSLARQSKAAKVDMRRTAVSPQRASR